MIDVWVLLFTDGVQKWCPVNSLYKYDVDIEVEKNGSEIKLEQYSIPVRCAPPAFLVPRGYEHPRLREMTPLPRQTPLHMQTPV